MLAPEGSPLARRCASLGNLCLALGILEIVYCGQRVIFQLMNSRILAAERTDRRDRPADDGLVMGLAMGTVAMSVWPVIAYVWAGRIRRDASTTAESSALGPEVGSSHEDHR